MAQFDSLLLEHGFANGGMPYDDHYPGEEDTVRIVLPVTIEGHHSISMIVDTGAPWCVLDPELASALRLTVEGDTYTPSRRLNIRGESYQGQLVRALIALQATCGERLTVEATIFVPHLEPETEWRIPNFLGLDGFLNRIRFAVDTAENMFYFGQD